LSNLTVLFCAFVAGRCCRVFRKKTTAEFEQLSEIPVSSKMKMMFKLHKSWNDFLSLQRML
jgi:hypothetical protein